MKLNHDSLFSVLTPDSFGSRPSHEFYTLNSLYGAEYAPDDADLQVNHYSQAYMSYTLMNMPVYGSYAFYTHTGTERIRFTPIDGMPDSKLLERFAMRSDDTLRLACVKYAIIGKYIIVNDDTLSVYA